MSRRGSGEPEDGPAERTTARGSTATEKPSRAAPSGAQQATRAETAGGLAGHRVVSFESRRSKELASLVRRHGGKPTQAPSMQEVPLEEQRWALEFGRVLFRGGCDLLVLLTGVGTTLLVRALVANWPEADVLARLGGVQLVCRGPKPVAALRAFRLRARVTAPEPNTWRELLEALDRALPLSGQRTYVQEYGARNQAFLDALTERGAEVHPIPVYAWQLPADLEPLLRGIRQLVHGEAKIALFTSAQQVEHVFQAAAQEQLTEALAQALDGPVRVGSVGPLTTEALKRHGVTADVEPAHPKMGHLVRALAKAVEDQAGADSAA